MPKGYVLAEVEITDPASFAEYGKQVAPTVHAYGGRYLVRGGDAQRMEGDHPARRFVVLEFPSPERAREWYDSQDYKPARDLRFSCAKTQLFIVAGVET